MHILIAGQAKSGTTALFYAIRNALAEEPETLFEPQKPEEYDELFRQAEGRDSVTKTLLRALFRCNPSLKGFDKRILIVRDPRDNLVSRLLYQLRDMQFPKDERKLAQFMALLKRKEASPEHVSIREMFALVETLEECEPLLPILEEVCSRSITLAKDGSFFVQKYEDMVDGRLTKLSKYLGLELEKEIEVDASHRRVVRTRSYGNWTHWFTEEDIAFYRPLFDPYLQAFGYEGWIPASPRKIDPAQSSEYVTRLLKRG